MLSISKEVYSKIQTPSQIREIFEESREIKKIHGENNVFDFSLGNPVVSPPKEFLSALESILKEDVVGRHGYINHQGLLEVREKVSYYLKYRYDNDILPKNIVMTVGAAGAINVALRSIINDGDEVILLVPYFLEYDYYIHNCRASVKYASLNKEFDIDIDKIEQVLSNKTRAIIINSPNNPTGKIFSTDKMKKLGKLLSNYEEKYDTKIYMIYDSPYDQLIYNEKFLNPFQIYNRIIYVGSFSKDFGIAGERLGYIAMDNEIEDIELLVSAFIYNNRVLGFVNAPALMQRAISKMNHLVINPEPYKRKKDLITKILKEAGYKFIEPDGGIFVFPKSPIKDDIKFCRELARQHQIFVVPGSSFGCKGHFRLSFSASESCIEGAAEGFRKGNTLFQKI
ncbi:MAG: pyridoxal phosphate-dependent aminotransferase [Bacillota bacterium]